MANTTKQSKLTAHALKSALWETLNNLRNDTCEPGKADSIATQAREILRTVNTQVKIASATGRKVANDVIEFAEDAE